MATNKFSDARSRIAAVVNGLETDILKQADVSGLLEEHRESWSLPKGLTGPAFARKLVDAKILRAHVFPFPSRTEKRFAKMKIPVLEVLQSVRSNAYFTHASAMQAHHIAQPDIRDIYLNFEQPAHERNGLPEQKSIDIAFRSKPRSTTNFIQLDDHRIVMLNGMLTGSLGVRTIEVTLLRSEPATVRVTDLERTLIDIIVRPHYAGGVENVLSAVISAGDRIDTEKVAAYLTALNHVYPYHQAVGWYLGRAGFSDGQLASLRVMPRDRNFYLAHQMKDPVFDEHWKIYVPKSLAAH